MPDFEKILQGEVRPPSIPADWIGRSTTDAAGWRWDDPNNVGNSVRFFAGNPSDPEPHKREAYVIVVSDGKVLGRNGEPMIGFIPPE